MLNFLNKDYCPFSEAHIHLIHNHNIKAEIRRQIKLTAGSSSQRIILRHASTVQPSAVLHPEPQPVLCSALGLNPHGATEAPRKASTLWEQSESKDAQESICISALAVLEDVGMRDGVLLWQHLAWGPVLLSGILVKRKRTWGGVADM